VADVRADRVAQLLAKLKEYGYSLPPEDKDRNAATSFPKMRTVDGTTSTTA
jgi:N-acetyl-anhydromuramyl-L-alanine amidase AmpD